MRMTTGLTALLILFACSDASGPKQFPNAGEFMLEVRGTTTIDVSGQAQLLQGLSAGTLSGIHLIGQTPNFFYRLELTFTPPSPPQVRTFAIGSSSAVRAVFYIYNRQTSQYDLIAVAQTGSLKLDACDLSTCRGTVTANAAQAETGASVTLSSSFHAK